MPCGRPGTHEIVAGGRAQWLETAEGHFPYRYCAKHAPVHAQAYRGPVEIRAVPASWEMTSERDYYDELGDAVEQFGVGIPGAARFGSGR